MNFLTKKLFLSFVSLLLSFSIYAYDFEIDGLYYEVNLEEMTATLVAGDKPYSGAITIPEKVTYKERTFAIVSINGAFKNCNALTSVIIPECITSLGTDTFSGCESLYEIIGMTGISEIGDFCFNSCTSLYFIDLPDKLTKIGSYAFEGCSNLKELILPENLNSIGDFAFSNCKQLSSLNIPSGITVLSTGLFYGCTSLNDFKIPPRTISIEDDVFKNCTNLSEIIIPSSTTTINNGVFFGCVNLKKVIFEDSSSTLSLGYNRISTKGNDEYRYPLFEDCPLRSVIIKRNISASGGYWRTGWSCFSNNTFIEEVILGDNITYLEEGVFLGCSSLKNLIIPRSITSIGEWAFYNSGLENIIFEDGYDNLFFDLSVSSWDYNTPHTFVGTQLSSIYLGRNIVISGGSQNPGYGGNPSTFFPTTIKTIIIGDLVSSINPLLLYNQKATSSLSHYSSLQNIQFGVNIPQIPSLIDNSNLLQLSLTTTIPPTAPPFTNSQYMDLSVLIPSGSKGEYSEALIWKNFWTISETEELLSTIENEGILYRILADNCLEVMKKATSYSGNISIPSTITYNNKQYTVVSIGEAFKGCSSLTSVSLPSSIEMLNNNCFKDCKNLIDVKISEGLKQIPVSAFENCTSLTGINLPNSIETIMAAAFKGCSSLERFSSPSALVKIDDEVFSNCISLKDFQCDENLSSLGVAAFSGCYNLEAFTFNSKIVVVPANIFNGCTNLVYLNNSNKITRIEANAFLKCKSLPSFKLPSVISISDNAFRNCTSLNKITFGNSLTSIGSYAFYGCSNIESLSIPSSVIDFGTSVFMGCTGLKELTFEDSDNPLLLPNGLFDTATGIQKKSVNGETIQFKIQYYKPYFYGLPIEKLYLGRNLSKDSRYTISGDGGVDYYLISLYDAPFGNLSKLKELTIGENVNILGTEQEYIPEVDLYVTPGSFKNCSSIQSVDVKNPTPPNGAEFSTTVYNNAKLHVPDNTYSLYSCTDGWKEFVNMIIAPNAIALDKETITMNVGDICKISATVYPENTTNKTITWISSNDSVVKVSNSGEVTGVSEGKATITASCGNVSASCEVEVAATNGIEDILVNPDEELHVYNLSGVLVAEGIKLKNLKQLASGYYIVVSQTKQWKIKI